MVPNYREFTFYAGCVYYGRFIENRFGVDWYDVIDQFGRGHRCTSDLPPEYFITTIEEHSTDDAWSRAMKIV